MKGIQLPQLPMSGIYRRMGALLSEDLRSDVDCLQIVTDGVPVRVYKNFKLKFKLRPDWIAPESTLRRRLSVRNARFTEEESERLVRVARVYAQAVDVFGDEEQALSWLSTPAEWLPEQPPITPLELAAKDSGARLVESRLLRTLHGIF